jgi:hypothetical protein
MTDENAGTTYEPIDPDKILELLIEPDSLLFVQRAEVGPLADMQGEIREWAEQFGPAWSAQFPERGGWETSSPQPHARRRRNGKRACPDRRFSRRRSRTRTELRLPGSCRSLTSRLRAVSSWRSGSRTRRSALS